MASTHAKAVRRAEALGRLSAALNINVSDLEATARGDAELARIMTLERLADALETQQANAPEPNGLRAAIQTATDDELADIPGVGPKTVEALRAWANEDD